MEPTDDGFSRTRYVPSGKYRRSARPDPVGPQGESESKERSIPLRFRNLNHPQPTAAVAQTAVAAIPQIQQNTTVVAQLTTTQREQKEDEEEVDIKGEFALYEGGFSTRAALYYLKEAGLLDQPTIQLVEQYSFLFNPEKFPKQVSLLPSKATLSIKSRHVSSVDANSALTLLTSEVFLNTQKTTTQPCVYIEVGDISGSMYFRKDSNGLNIPGTSKNLMHREYMRILLNRLTENDMLACVNFDHDVMLAIPLHRVTAKHREESLKIINDLNHKASFSVNDGGTDLRLAFRRAMEIASTAEVYLARYGQVHRIKVNIILDGKNDENIPIDFASNLYESLAKNSPNLLAILDVTICGLNLDKAGEDQARRLVAPFGKNGRFLNLSIHFRHCQANEIAERILVPVPPVVLGNLEVRVLNGTVIGSQHTTRTIANLVNQRMNGTSQVLIQHEPGTVPNVVFCGKNLLTDKIDGLSPQLYVGNNEKEQLWLRNVQKYRQALMTIFQKVTTENAAQLSQTLTNLFHELPNEHIVLKRHALRIKKLLAACIDEASIKSLKQEIMQSDQALFHPLALNFQLNQKPLVRVIKQLERKGLFKWMTISETARELRKKPNDHFFRLSSEKGCIVLCLAEEVQEFPENKQSKLQYDFFESHGKKYKAREELFEVELNSSGHIGFHINNEQSCLHEFDGIENLGELLWAIPHIKRLIKTEKMKYFAHKELLTLLKDRRYRRTVVGFVATMALQGVSCARRAFNAVINFISHLGRCILTPPLNCIKSTGRLLHSLTIVPLKQLCESIGNMVSSICNCVETVFRQMGSCLSRTYHLITNFFERNVLTPSLQLGRNGCELLHRMTIVPLTQLCEGIGNVIRSICNCVETVFRQMGSCLSHTYTRIANPIGSCFTRIGKLFGNCCESIQNNLSQCCTSLGNIAQRFVANPLSSCCEHVGKAISQICNCISTVFENILSGLTRCFNFVVTPINRCSQAVGNMCQRINHALGEVLNSICTGLSNVCEGISNLAHRFILQPISSFATSVANCVQTICSSLFNCLTTIFNQVTRPFFWSYRQVYTVVSGTVNRLSSVAHQIVQPCKRGYERFHHWRTLRNSHQNIEDRHRVRT